MEFPCPCRDSATIRHAAGIFKVILFIFIAPLLGMAIAFLFSVLTMWIVRRRSPHVVDVWFRRLQRVSAAGDSQSHGANDAQKTMGIITLVLMTNNLLSGEVHVPFWVLMASHGFIALGTLVGGWKVIKTLGMRMTKLSPFGGFSAESSAGLTIIFATILGIPVSTTHTITGSIIGVGAVRGVSAVRWGVARNILWAWVLTIPLAAGFAVLAYLVLEAFGL